MRIAGSHIVDNIDSNLLSFVDKNIFFGTTTPVAVDKIIVSGIGSLRVVIEIDKRKSKTSVAEFQLISNLIHQGVDQTKERRAGEAEQITEDRPHIFLILFNETDFVSQRIRCGIVVAPVPSRRN